MKTGKKREGTKTKQHLVRFVHAAVDAVAEGLEQLVLSRLEQVVIQQLLHVLVASLQQRDGEFQTLLHHLVGLAGDQRHDLKGNNVGFFSSPFLSSAGKR